MTWRSDFIQTNMNLGVAVFLMFRFWLKRSILCSLITSLTRTTVDCNDLMYTKLHFPILSWLILFLQSIWMKLLLSLIYFAIYIFHVVFPCFLCQSKAVLCPMSGHPIKMNELLDVKFTPLDPSLDRVALLTRQVSVECSLPNERSQQILSAGNLLEFQWK